jgi:hypothetical protein
MTLHARAVASRPARRRCIDRVADEIARSGDVSPERARSVLLRLAEVSK